MATAVLYVNGTVMINGTENQINYEFDYISKALRTIRITHPLGVSINQSDAGRVYIEGSTVDRANMLAVGTEIPYIIAEIVKVEDDPGLYIDSMVAADTSKQTV